MDLGPASELNGNFWGSLEIRKSAFSRRAHNCQYISFLLAGCEMYCFGLPCLEPKCFLCSVALVFPVTLSGSQCPGFVDSSGKRNCSALLRKSISYISPEQGRNKII